MTISTLDALLAGMQPGQYFYKVATPTMVVGRPQSLWYQGGNPGAGAVAANTAGGVNHSSSSALVTGQIPHYDGAAASYLARFGCLSPQPGTILLCDRLQTICGNSGGSQISVTSTSAQTINSNTLPARDKAASTNGDGVLCGLEVAGAVGAGTGQTATLSYTDESGNAGSTSVNVDPSATASAPQGTFYRMSLAAGDTGMRSIQSLTLSATFTSGQLALVMYRVLAHLECGGVVSGGNAVDALTGGFPKLANGVVPFLIWLPSVTSAIVLGGHYVESQG